MSQTNHPPHTTLQDKRILVTGGSGFLGSHLLRRLVKLKARVSAFVRPSSNTEKISDLIGRISLVKGDLTQRADVEQAVQKIRPQIIFHLAADGVNPQRSDASTIIHTNVLGLVHLIESLTSIPYERFVNSGSCFEYGTQNKPLSEDHPLVPVNTYAASKILAWHLLNLERKRHHKPIVTIRPFTFFGPQEPSYRLIPSVIQSILKNKEIHVTSGQQTRDYTYVEDMVEAFLLASVNEQAAGETLNIGSGEERTVKEIAEHIRNLMKSRVPIRFGSVKSRNHEAWRICADSFKAKRILGWTPKVSFNEGILKTAHQMKVQADIS